MSEQIDKNTPLTIEDHFRAVLSGDKLKNALDYLAYKRSKGILPGDTPSGEGNGWKCWNFDLGVIGYEPNDGIPGWFIGMGGLDSAFYRSDYQNYPIDEKLKAFAWAHDRPCYHFKTNGKACGCGNQPGRSVTLFGKVFDHSCQSGLEMRNPDGEALELTKRLSEVLAQMQADAAKKDKPYVLGENEWPSVLDILAHTGRPLGKVYTKSLDVQFYITPQHKYVHDAVIAFSGGGWIPITWQQVPAALHIGGSGRFEAFKGLNEGWAYVETLKYQANVTYFAEMSFNIADNIYNATVWMLDAYGEQDTPYLIAKDYPFRFGTGDPVIPRIKAIDTVYLVTDNPHSGYIVRDFKVVSGE